MKTIIIDDKTVSVDGVIFERKEPEFKVGQWVIGINGCRPINPSLLIEKRNGSNFKYDDFTGRDNSEVSVSVSYCRPATHSEIESHLIKVAKEKGFKEGVKYSPRNIYGSSGYYILKGNYKYHEGSDYLDAETDSFTATIYKEGKWAEIIPSKKPLPKTKEEFNAFLGAWNNRHTHSTNEFLEDYE